jgi:hypothetical protein
MAMDDIINKVAASGIQTLDPAVFLPAAEDLVVFDLKPFLFRELILKEKDFREALKTHDWAVYQDRTVTICCTADAIIPMWAYMLVTSYLKPVAADILYGSRQDAVRQMTRTAIENMDAEPYRDQRIVLKGCGDQPISEDAYIALMKKLQPVVKSVMFGEPCSTVPVYKQKKG